MEVSREQKQEASRGGTSSSWSLPFNRNKYNALFGSMRQATQNFLLYLVTNRPSFFTFLFFSFYLSFFFFFIFVFVMPDVRIPKQEERSPPRQCNSQKGKFIADSSQGSCRIQRSGAGQRAPSPSCYTNLQVEHRLLVVGLSGLVTSLQSNFFGQNLHAYGTFPGVSTLFLIGTQRSVLS